MRENIYDYFQRIKQLFAEIGEIDDCRIAKILIETETPNNLLPYIDRSIFRLNNAQQIIGILAKKLDVAFILRIIEISENVGELNGIDDAIKDYSSYPKVHLFLNIRNAFLSKYPLGYVHDEISNEILNLTYEYHTLFIVYKNKIIIVGYGDYLDEMRYKDGKYQNLKYITHTFMLRIYIDDIQVFQTENPYRIENYNGNSFSIKRKKLQLKDILNYI